MGCKDRSAYLAKLADKGKELESRWGQRPYRVQLVLLSYPGGAVGRGTPQLAAVVELTPRPLVQGLEGVNSSFSREAVLEEGGARVEGISGQNYKEEDLTGFPGRAVEKHQLVLWEIFFPGGAKRRFTLTSPPVFSPKDFSWRVSLERAPADRAPEGGLDDAW